MALVSPGDEVVLIEPLYDCYLPMVRRAGGVPVRVRVSPPEWRLDEQAVRAAFSGKTKAILINNPMNPTAKVFSEAELTLIADLCREHDAYAICDEVYEHLVFDGLTHRPLMAFDGMRDRTVRIGSAGKTFSLTGWKVGYITGPAGLIDPIAKAHQWVTFTTPPNLQRAVAYGLQKDDGYYRGLAEELAAKRDRMANGLRALGFSVLPCSATYFPDLRVCRSWPWEQRCRGLRKTGHGSRRRRRSGCPPFMVPTRRPANIRFCFCKKDWVIDEALARLSAFLTAAEGESA